MRPGAAPSHSPPSYAQAISVKNALSVRLITPSQQTPKKCPACSGQNRSNGLQAPLATPPFRAAEYPFELARTIVSRMCRRVNALDAALIQYGLALIAPQALLEEAPGGANRPPRRRALKKWWNNRTRFGCNPPLRRGLSVSFVGRTKKRLLQKVTICDSMGMILWHIACSFVLEGQPVRQVCAIGKASVLKHGRTRSGRSFF